MTHLGFGVWGTLGPRGQVGGVMLVLRTYHELVGRSVKKFGGDWSSSSGMKRVYR